jgi:hypothetical protein
MKWLIGLFLCFYVLIVIVAARRVVGLSLNLEISAIDLANLFVGLFIAIFLQYYLATTVNDRRHEKSILIDALREASADFRACRETFHSCVDEGRISADAASTMKTRLRGLANTLDLFERTLDQSVFAGAKGDYGMLKSHFFNYKGALTGGSFPANPYSSEAVQAEDRAYRQLHTSIFEMMFRIIRRR